MKVIGKEHRNIFQQKYCMLQFIIVYGLIGYEPLTYEDYQYPVWANVLGWAIAGSSVFMIPAVAIYKLITTPGTLRQVQKSPCKINFDEILIKIC